MHTSRFLTAGSSSAPGYQHTQVTITPERERGRTLVSYNFLLLIFLIVIHWVFPGLGSSASVLKNTESETLLTLPQPTSIPCQGYSSLALEPQIWKTGLQIMNEGQQRDKKATQTPSIIFPPSLFPLAGSNHPAPSTVKGEASPAAGRSQGQGFS